MLIIMIIKIPVVLTLILK